MTCPLRAGLMCLNARPTTRGRRVRRRGPRQRLYGHAPSPLARTHRTARAPRCVRDLPCTGRAPETRRLSRQRSLRSGLAESHQTRHARQWHCPFEFRLIHSCKVQLYGIFYGFIRLYKVLYTYVQRGYVRWHGVRLFTVWCLRPPTLITMTTKKRMASHGDTVDEMQVRGVRVWTVL